MQAVEMHQQGKQKLDFAYPNMVMKDKAAPFVKILGYG